MSEPFVKVSMGPGPEIEAQLAGFALTVQGGTPTLTGPNGGGSGLVGASGIIWRPGGVAGGNVFTSWASAFAAAMLVNDITTIYVDSSIAPAIIPPGTYDGQGMLLLAQFGVAPTQMTIADGATLQDIGMSSLNTPNAFIVICECVTTSAFSLSDFSTLIIYGSILIQLGVGALVPALMIGATGNNVIVATGSPAIDNTNAPTVPVVEIAAGGILNIEIYTQFFPFFVTGNEVGGPVGSTLNFFRDSSLNPFSSSLFLGTLSDFRASITTNENSGSATAGQVATADGAGLVVWAPIGTAPALGVGGVSAAPIVANVTAGSRFFFALKTPGGTPGFPFPSSIVPGSPGSFKISSTNVADTSVYEYEVRG